MKRASLFFKRAELLYDATNYSFVEGDILPADEEHVRHQIMDITAEGNIDRVTRVLNLAFAECLKMLYPYSKTEAADNTELDDVLNAPEEYAIELMFPKDVAQNTVNYLLHLLHEYIVCRVLEEWLLIVYPGKAMKWREKTDRLRTQIKSCMVDRSKPVRLKMSPF